MRKKVLLEISASSASSSSVVASKPLSVNRRSAASASARRVRSFLRSRSGRERSPAGWVVMPGILPRGRNPGAKEAEIFLKLDFKRVGVPLSGDGGTAGGPRRGARGHAQGALAHTVREEP